MGRSPSSCLKIIACGGDAADNDDVAASEAKASGDKRGWSFRKRSGRHRVLGNNVSSETTTVTDKEVPRGINTDFQAPVKPNIPDEKSQLPRPVEKITDAVFGIEHGSESKTSALVVTSKNDSSATCAEPKMSHAVVTFENGSNETSADSKIGSQEVVAGNDSNTASAECKLHDSVAVSEADCNTFSAESKMGTQEVVSGDDSNTASAECKMDNSVAVSEADCNTISAQPKIPDSVAASEKSGDAGVIIDEPVATVIQTAIRGFLAQREFVQLKSAIKLQAAIRGHLVRRNAVETLHCIQAIVKVQGLVRARSSKHLDQKNEPNEAQFSTVKLLKNSFARQLLESRQKPKSMKIRCDPLRPNSAWGWLERWMSVSTSEADQKSEPSVEPEDDSHVREIAVQADAELSSAVLSDSVDSKLDEVVESEKNKENHIIHDVNTDTVDSQLYPSSTEVETEQSHTQRTVVTEDDVASLADASSHKQAEPNSVVEEPALEIEKPKLSAKRPASEELDGEVKKIVCGSKKSSNPAFIAAQSKFEELSSAANSGNAVSSSLQDVGAEFHVDSASSVEETVKPNEPSIVEAAPLNPRVHVARSECGTELSVSSTLDSPDRSDFGNAEGDGNKFLEERPCDPNSREGPGDEANDNSKLFVTDSPSVPIQQEEAHENDGASGDPLVTDISPQDEQKLKIHASVLQTNSEPVGSVMVTDSSQMEQKNDLNGVDMKIERSSGTEHQAYKSSPEASPSSHMTVPESQGTPSSQVSVKSKRNKIGKSGSNTKRSSLSAGKRFQSNLAQESGERSSTDNLSKDHQSGKRRTSFGSTKSENVDQEPRDSSTRNPLPSYMQATESAKAKASSPRSSPDVHDKEVYSRKRHSLPGASGREVSPRIQRSTSQAAQGAKANGSNERKWQR